MLQQCLLFLGYASFVFSIYRRGYKVQSQGEYSIVFWHKDDSSGEYKYDPYHVNNKRDSDCGCLEIHSDAMDKRFGMENAKSIRYECQKKLETTPNKPFKKLHCNPKYMPEVKTEIESKEIVECLNPCKEI